MIKTLFDNSIIKLSFHSKGKTLFMEWKRSISLEEYQRAMIECLEFGRIYDIESFITDIRNQDKVTPDNKKWFETQILPTAIHETSLKRAAAIHNGSDHQQKYLEGIRASSRKYKIPFKSFSSADAAFRWLKKSKFNLIEILFGQ